MMKGGGTGLFPIKQAFFFFNDKNKFNIDAYKKYSCNAHIQNKDSEAPFFNNGHKITSTQLGIQITK